MEGGKFGGLFRLAARPCWSSRARFAGAGPDPAVTLRTFGGTGTGRGRGDRVPRPSRTELRHPSQLQTHDFEPAKRYSSAMAPVNNHTPRDEALAFEQEVRRVAGLLYPDIHGGAAMVEGRERDGIFVTDDTVIALEATVSR